MSATPVRLEAARPAHAAALAAMARTSFTDTFAHLYAPRDLAAFLDAVFTEPVLAAEIADPATPLMLACAGDAIAGFCKLGPRAIPIAAPESAIELRQLYVARDWQGAGVAARLMDWALATARARGHAALLLSVYVDNHRARRFYERYGFVDIGRYDFPVGDQIDEDRVMLLTL